ADGLGKGREGVEALRDGERLALRLAPLLRGDPVPLHLLDLPVRQERAGVELPCRRGRRRGSAEKNEQGQTESLHVFLSTIKQPRAERPEAGLGWCCPSSR